MSDFDKIVQGARKKVDPATKRNEPIKISRPIEYAFNDNGYSQEVWPMSFRFDPKVGDLVMSKSGRTLKICSITHGISGVIITLGRELGGSSPTTGSGGSPLGPMEI